MGHTYDIFVSDGFNYTRLVTFDGAKNTLVMRQ